MTSYFHDAMQEQDQYLCINEKENVRHVHFKRVRQRAGALVWLYGIEMYCMPTTLAPVNNGAQNELLN